MFGASSELAPNMFGTSSELASVMEYGFKWDQVESTQPSTLRDTVE